MAAATAHAPGGAAVGGSNPSGDGGGPRLRSPPGKGNKPVALADITNVGRPNTTSRSVSIGDVLKENTKLIHLVNEKAKIVELSRVEIHKLRIALQRTHQQNLQLTQQNLQLTQANSQMLMELNMGKDRIKSLQHELSCTTALLKVKNSELERKNRTANQRRKEVNSHVLKSISSEGAAVEARQVHGSVTSGVVPQLLTSQSAIPSRTVCQEPPQDATLKRGKNKRKSGSNECIKDTNIMQEHYMPHLEPILSLDHEDPRKIQRRRSSRLNQVPCEIAEVSHKTLRDDIIVPSSSTTLSVQEQHGPTAGKDTGKSLQNETSAVVHEELMSSVVEEVEINEQPQKEVNLKVQEACSSVTGVEAHQIDVKACDTKQSNLATQSSVPFNITEPPKLPEDTCVKRKSQRRKSTRLNSASSENTGSTFETLHEDDVIAPSSSSTSVQEQHGPASGKDLGKSLQNECSAVVHEELMCSVVEEIEINEQPQKEVNLKVQEVCSSVTRVESHQIEDKACDTKQSHLASQSSVPFNITEPPKPPEETCIKRKSQRRKSARLNSASSDNTDSTFERLHEDDFIAPLASSSSIASMEQKTTQKQNDACSSMKSTVGQVVAGRRSLRRAAEKVVSYKEIPLNVKMRRP